MTAIITTEDNRRSQVLAGDARLAVKLRTVHDSATSKDSRSTVRKPLVQAMPFFPMTQFLCSAECFCTRFRPWLNEILGGQELYCLLYIYSEYSKRQNEKENIRIKKETNIFIILNWFLNTLKHQSHIGQVTWQYCTRHTAGRSASRQAGRPPIRLVCKAGAEALECQTACRRGRETYGTATGTVTATATALASYCWNVPELLSFHKQS
jgi:hypothetical protein